MYCQKTIIIHGKIFCMVVKPSWPSATCHPYSPHWLDFHYFLCSVKQGNLWIIYWKGCRREKSWPILRYYPSVCLKQLRNTTKTLSQNSQPPGPDFNLTLPEYEAGMLTCLHKVGKIFLKSSSANIAERWSNDEEPDLLWYEIHNTIQCRIRNIEAHWFRYNK
jgi:hypothetical protein